MKNYNCYFVAEFSVMHKSGILVFLLAAVLLLSGCARRGTITGGAKDTIPPSLRNSFPKNGSLNFSGKEIQLVFDEYVKLKNVNKQLIVSPPLKTKPEVMPLNASKIITITLKDELQPNTTYSFNFGQSIEDNNEGNPLNQFSYVFSTGNYIDSLQLKTAVKDALEKEIPKNVSIMLYEVNESYNDSTIYKEVPRYITNTLESGRLGQLENLKAGKYRLIAVKDENGNNKFDPKTDKIGFIKEPLTVPNDTIFELELFKEEAPFRIEKPYQTGDSHYIIGYQGNPKKGAVDVWQNGEKVKATVTKYPKKDSLQLWLPKIKNDTLAVVAYDGKWSKSYRMKPREMKPDSLYFSTPSSDLSLRKKLQLFSAIPLTAIDNSKIKITDKDSAVVRFTTEYDEWNQAVLFTIDRQPLQTYKMQILPGAFTDFFARKNDTLNYKFSTRNTGDFGNLRISLSNVKRYPVLVQLTNEKGEVLETETVNNGTNVAFDLIEPKKYTLRVVYDDNRNNAWDPGSFWEKRQSEEVIYFPKELDVRANWDVEQPFDLGLK